MAIAVAAFALLHVHYSWAMYKLLIYWRWIEK